jgi:hypothetical protein
LRGFFAQMIAQGATVGTRLTREALAYSAGEKDSKFQGLKFYDAVFTIP